MKGEYMANTNKLSFANSEQVRLSLSKAQEKQIATMYSNLSKEISKEIKALSGRTNVSSVMRTSYLKTLQKQLNEESRLIHKRLLSSLPSNMKQVAEAVVKDNVDFAKSIGLSITGAFSNVPTDIVSRIVTGKVYDSNWTLSKALWSSNSRVQSDVNTVIAKGIALNKPSIDIAKDLEKYVDPKAKKDWEWSKVYPNTNKRVDYSAQRLARTLTSHAYQQALVETTKPNPFVTGLEWQSAGIHGRTCELCMSRDGVVFSKFDLPLDHPMGLCTFLAVIPEAGNIGDRLADWYNNPSGTYPDIDGYAKALGYGG